MVTASHHTRSRASPVVAAIDIGSSKICCAIAIGSPDGAEVIGFAQQRSEGVKAGTIVEGARVERALWRTIADAGQMAGGIPVPRATLAVGCGRLAALRFMARAEPANGIVSDGDVARILAGGEAYAERGGRMLVQLHNDLWQLDGVDGFPDPRGMAARRIAADLTAVTADEAPVRNLLAAVERCDVRVSGLLATPFASARAVTTAEERQHGVIVLDLGAGMTSIAAFAEEQLLIAEAIPFGAHLITLDLARRFAIPETEAERLKVRHGTMLPTSTDHLETIPIPAAGPGGRTRSITRAELRAIIVARVDATIAAVAERLTSAGIAPGGLDRIVLTGGGALLAGLDVHVTTALQGSARIGTPAPLAGVPEMHWSPATATIAGLVLDSLEAELAQRISGAWRRPRSQYAELVGRWLAGRRA